MSEIHNAELTQDIIAGTLVAWLEQTNDSTVVIDVGFQRDSSHISNNDLLASTKVNILKAEDFHPMKRGQHAWVEDDQKAISDLERKRYEPKGEGERPKSVMGSIRDVIGKLTSRTSGEESSKQKSSEPASPPRNPKKRSDEVVKHVAVRWELPSGDFYPVKYVEGVRRKLNLRKSFTELDTAQEAPAVREKGEAVDKTDQDCRTLPADLTSSRDSLATEAPTQTPSPEKEKEVVPPVPVKSPEKAKEEKKEEVPKVEEEKKEEVSSRRSKRKIQMNVKRRPDCGGLQILAEKEGVVTFSCFTKHRVKKVSVRKTTDK